MINHRDWYWVVADNATKVYSSARNIEVPLDDPDFVAWNVGGERFSVPIATWPELWTVLSGAAPGYIPIWLYDGETFAQPAIGQFTKPQLKNYSATVRFDKMRGGIVVNGIPFPTDALTLSALNAAVIYTSDKQINAFSWKLPDGTFITLDTAGVKDLQSAVSEFGQNCFACEDQTQGEIEAGTVSALPAVDAKYAAVSNSFTGMAVQRRKK